MLQVLEGLRGGRDRGEMGAMIGGLRGASRSTRRAGPAGRGLGRLAETGRRTASWSFAGRRRVPVSGRLRAQAGQAAAAQPLGGPEVAFEARALLLDAPGSPILAPAARSAVATDVESGGRIVLDHGDLVESILASLPCQESAPVLTTAGSSDGGIVI